MKLDQGTAEERATPRDLVHSPSTCTTIHPAAEFHYDIKFGTTRSWSTDELAEFVAAELAGHQDSICKVYPDARKDRPTEEPFLGQAEVVLNHCKEEPYRLRDAPNEHWKDTRDMLATEQVERLKRLAEAIGYQLDSES